MTAFLRLIAVLAALGPAAVAAEPQAGDIRPGVYVAQVREGCAKVRVNEEIRWTWDAGCDGSIDSRGSDVEVDGGTVNVRDVTLELLSVEPESFTGQYSYGLGLITPEVTFRRRGEAQALSR
jgi:hypothetical protein